MLFKTCFQVLQSGPQGALVSCLRHFFSSDAAAAGRFRTRLGDAVNMITSADERSQDWGNSENQLLALTDWDVFKDAASDTDEYTNTVASFFCQDVCVPEK